MLREAVVRNIFGGRVVKSKIINRLDGQMSSTIFVVFAFCKSLQSENKQIVDSTVADRIMF